MENADFTFVLVRFARWGGSPCDEDERDDDETRGAQQPKLMHREEVGGWRWEVGGERWEVEGGRSERGVIFIIWGPLSNSRQNRTS